MLNTGLFLLGISVDGSAGAVLPNLGALSLSASTFAGGIPASGTILGATALSTITSSGLPSGFTINSGARTWAWDGTGSASASSLTLSETLAGYGNSPRANVLGYIITAGLTLGAMALTETSVAGTNPPTWDFTAPDIQDGDTIELYFTTDASAPVVGTPNETHIAVATEETITWTTWPSAFANGATVKWAMRYGRNPGGGMVWSPLSNILSDVMPVPANVTGIQRGIYDLSLGFGSGPGIKNGVAIAGNSKVVLTVAFWANPLGGQSLTSITANSGAISFTRVAGIAATANKQIWYADVGSVTNLDLTFNVGGSTQLIDFSVDELSNAVAGGPSSTYIAEISTSAVDGGLVVPTAPAPGLGIIGLYVNASATYTGATKEAEGAVDGTGQLVSVAYLAATGAVTVSGPTGNRWVINSAWAHA